MKLTFREASDIATKIKQEYGFGTDKCPSWFKSICVGMEQDNGFGVSICIPSHEAVPQEVKDRFTERYQNTWIGFRVITPPSYKSIKTKEEKVPITKVETKAQ